MLGKRLMGITLILIGSALALETMGLINLSWNLFWPLFLLVPGLGFHVAFFASDNRNPGLLVPGGILTTYGLLFLFMELTAWSLMHILWPVFILGVALGLFELYIFGPRENALLIPVGILSLVGFAFLLINLLNIGGGALIGLALIAIGAITLLQGNKPRL
ncbi:MAG TPA: DUF5668 domain-containing protein [Verrucomicrobiae bacterium]|nr:DUF5668 domain-containing protein [Verrucomicrobiae bacterium]